MQSKIVKTIYLLRHAKSDWDAPFSSDLERGLAERGKRNANSLRKFLRLYRVSFDLAYVSNSRRTIETLAILNKKREFVKKIHIFPELYECSPDEYFKFIQSTNDKLEKILFIGHNPEIEAVANLLLGNQTSNSLFSKFSTCAFLTVTFETESWKDISNLKGKLNFFWLPHRIEKI